MAAPVPPHSIEAEESVIGGVLVHPRVLPIVAGIALPGDFYHPSLGVIMTAFVELQAAGKPVDALTVAAYMTKAGTLERLKAAGGSDYFGELMSKVVTVENLEYHARIVKEKATARRLIAACSEVAARGYAGDELQDLIDTAMKAAYSASMDTTADGHRQMAQVLRELRPVLATRYERRESAEVSGIPTGFTRFDEMTTGLQPGTLTIIAGQPSMGKSCLAMNIVDHAAAEPRKIPALVFSLEMSRGSMAERLIAKNAGVSATMLRNGRITVEGWKRIKKAESDMSERPIYLDDTGNLPLLEILARGRRWRMKESKGAKLAMIVVDFMQLVPAPHLGKTANENDVITAVATSLKGLARETNTAVVALSQLNRSGDEGARPTMRTLRGSGAIGQAGDVIAFIHRQEEYETGEAKKKCKGKAELIVGKQREGATGVIPLQWVKEHQEFRDPVDVVGGDECL